MTLAREVAAELFSMFVADLGLTLAVLAVVAVAAFLIGTGSVPPAVGGGLLLVGSVAALVGGVARAARRERKR